MGRLGCFGLLISFAFLWGGGQKCYTAYTNSKPTVLTCAEYARTKPSATWIKLTECRLMPHETVYFERFGKITELFVPVRPAKEEAGKIHVLLALKDDASIASFQRVVDAKDKNVALGAFITQAAALLKRQEVEGLVRFGIDLKDSDRTKLSRAQGTLTSDFIILNDGEKPGMLVGAALALVGLVIGAASLSSSRKK